MDLIIYSDGLQLVPVTKQMLADIKIYAKVDCFELCEILRLKLTTFMDAPFNHHIMSDGSGYFYGCMC